MLLIQMDTTIQNNKNFALETILKKINKSF